MRSSGGTVALAIFLGLVLAAACLAPCLGGAAVPARLDLADFFWPMKAYTAERWAAGSVPLWNPLAGCGEPWLAQLQTGVLYPGDAVFFLPWPWGPLASIALHLVLAAAGMAVFLDGLGTSRPASIAGALVFASGGAFLSLVPVYNNFCTAAFLPWIFHGARRVARGDGVAGFVLAAALAFLAGEPALAVAAALAAATIAVVTAGEADRSRVPPGRAAMRVVGALLLASGITAAAAMPFGELLFRSGRLTGATRGEATARPVGVEDLLDLALPPDEAATRRPSPGRGGYLVTLALGPLALVLAAGCVAGLPERRRLLASLGALGVLGVLLSLGLLAPALWDAGVLRGLRFPARWFVFAHFSLAVAVAAGLDGWLFGRFGSSFPKAILLRDPAVSEAAESPHLVPPLVKRLVAVLFLATAGLLLARALDGGRLTGAGRARAVLVLGAAAAGTALVVSYRFVGRPGPRPAAWILVFLVAAPLPWAASEALATAPASALGVRPRILRDLPRGSPERVFAAVSDPFLLARWTMPAGSWTAESAVRAHDALAGYVNLRAGIATAGTASPIENPRRVRLLGAALSGGNAGTIFGLADVKHVVTPFPVSLPSARLVGRVDSVALYELPSALGRVFFAREARVAGDDAAFAALKAPGFDPESVAFVAASERALPPPRALHGYSVARVTSDASERTELEAVTSEPGLLVVTRSWDPGWKAAVDGEEVPLLRADLAFMGVSVPQGEHRVTLTYRPVSFRAGALISALSVIVLLGLVLAGGRPRESMR